MFESEAAESYRPKQPIIGSVPSVALPAGGVQQHVHHHFHHGESGDGIKAAPSVVDPGFSPISGPLYSGGSDGQSLYGQGGQNGYGGNFDNYENPGSQFYKKQLNLKPPTTSE